MAALLAGAAAAANRLVLRLNQFRACLVMVALRLGEVVLGRDAVRLLGVGVGLHLPQPRLLLPHLALGGGQPVLGIRDALARSDSDA
ncbi:hypothetical protein KZ780_13280 [Mycolicibacterium smegmatis]|uniref:hypothetical protein n=1 Tax=Mycolicibacterium smegmatis TaxID=1772 RepID=UPI001EFA3462|nr:hypothetical protein [Mycolicibacterium smegmatis]ULN31419.1 hypothetical protein KZ780_13280 [Mycolicibacterium smegmatis]